MSSISGRRNRCSKRLYYSTEEKSAIKQRLLVLLEEQPTLTRHALSLWLQTNYGIHRITSYVWLRGWDIEPSRPRARQRPLPPTASPPTASPPDGQDPPTSAAEPPELGAVTPPDGTRPNPNFLTLSPTR
jgi:hypothetical protein